MTSRFGSVHAPTFRGSKRSAMTGTALPTPGPVPAPPVRSLTVWRRQQADHHGGGGPGQPECASAPAEVLLLAGAGEVGGPGVVDVVEAGRCTGDAASEPHVVGELDAGGHRVHLVVELVLPLYDELRAGGVVLGADGLGVEVVDLLVLRLVEGSAGHSGDAQPVQRVGDVRPELGVEQVGAAAGRRVVEVAGVPRGGHDV